jgi:hypothetical protein
VLVSSHSPSLSGKKLVTSVVYDFSKAGLPGEAAAYGVSLALEGYKEMRDLAHA